MNLFPLVTRRVLFLTVLLGGAGLRGQTAPASSSPAPDAGAANQPITLDPFVVDTKTDNGYTAVNALIGGRTQIELKDNPAEVSVFTSQFLSDIDSTNFRTAANWSMNYVVAPEVPTNGFGGFTVNLRNQGASFEARNGFLAYIESDAFSVDRYEFDFGPNGIEYGDAGPGGTSTTWTKQAFFGKPLYEVDSQVNSFGGFRTTVDVDQPLNDKVSLRFDALEERAPTWHDFTRNDRQGAYLAGTIKLTDEDTFRFDSELGKSRRSIYPNYYTDQASYWNGSASYNGVTAPSTTNTGVQKTASTPYEVYLPGTPNGGLNDLESYYRSTGTTLALLPTAETRNSIANFPSLPWKSYELQPPDQTGQFDYYTYAGYWEHRFSDNFFTQTAYDLQRTIRTAQQAQFATYRVDVNTVLPGGAPNPNFGEPYADAQPLDQQEANLVNDFRQMLTWKFDNSWMKENLNGIVGYRWEDYDQFNLALRVTNGADQIYTDPANQFMERRYWDQEGESLGPIPQIAGVNLAYLPTLVTHQRKDLQYDQVLSNTQFFGDKLNLVVGVRRDTGTNTQETTTGIPVDAAHGMPVLGSVVPPPGGGPPVAVVGKPSWIRENPVSTNAGAVYWVVPAVGLFANFGETFALPGAGANLIDGTPPGVSKSEGDDAGLKLNFMGGRISGSIDYYKSVETDNLVTGVDTTQINQIWQDLGQTALDNLTYRDTQSQVGEGWEIQLTANPIPNVRMLFNLAFPRSWATNLNPGFHEYVAANLATWQAGANSTTNPNASQIASDIATITQEISSETPGTTLTGDYKYTSNVFAEYMFTNGLLKNLSVGAGANIRGPQKEGVGQDSAYDYLYSPYYYVITANLEYNFHLTSNLPCTVQLNVTNLLNSERFIYTSFATYRVGGITTNPLIQVPGNTLIPDPREFTLSAKIAF